VIDFIDMANPKNRASVEDALRQELERDRTKTYVVEISPLGLVEMTRQNVTDGPREILTRKCPTCAGDGIVVSDHTVAMQVERKLRALASPGNRLQAYKVALHPRVLELLVGRGGARLAAIEEATRRRFFLVPGEGHIHADHFEVVAEGKLVDLEPSSPLTAGTTVELKLGEVGRYDAGAAVGRIEGVEVLVADAAKQVGKKATVAIGLVLEGQAFATLVSSAVTGDGPITFESEAEKPTRAPAKRKTAAAAPGEELGGEPTEATVAEDDEAADELEPGEIAADEAVGHDAEADEDAEAGTDGAAVGEDGVAPVKKRTRRGSRGGKRRRKPAAGAAANDAADGEELTGVSGEADGTADEQVGATDVVTAGETDEAPAPRAPRRRAPRIHVPDAPGSLPPSPEVIQEAIEETAAPETLPEVASGAPSADGDEPTAEVDGDDADGQVVAKKRTRRGTRGGRNRRKKTPAELAAAAAGEADEIATVAVVTVVADDADLDAEPDLVVEPVQEAEPEAVAEAELDETAADDAPGEDPGYVPMSEWLDDFDRR
jgi:ribonuclease G